MEIDDVQLAGLGDEFAELGTVKLANCRAGCFCDLCFGGACRFCLFGLFFFDRVDFVDFFSHEIDFIAGDKKGNEAGESRESFHDGSYRNIQRVGRVRKAKTS